MTAIIQDARSGRIYGTLDLSIRQIDIANGLQSLSRGFRAEAILAPEQMGARAGFDGVQPDTEITVTTI